MSVFSISIRYIYVLNFLHFLLKNLNKIKIYIPSPLGWLVITGQQYWTFGWQLQFGGVEEIPENWLEIRKRVIKNEK